MENVRRTLVGQACALRHCFYNPPPCSHINSYIEYDINYTKGARMSYLLWASSSDSLLRKIGDYLYFKLRERGGDYNNALKVGIIAHIMSNMKQFIAHR